MRFLSFAGLHDLKLVPCQSRRIARPAFLVGSGFHEAAHGGIQDLEYMMMFSSFDIRSKNLSGLGPFSPVR